MRNSYDYADIMMPKPARWRCRHRNDIESDAKTASESPTLISFITKFLLEPKAICLGDHFLGRHYDDTLHRTANGGLIFADGPNWREQRRLSVQIFRTMGMGKNVMEQQVKRCIEELLVQMGEIDNLKHVDMFQPLQVNKTC
jgi:hypothetical protein